MCCFNLGYPLLLRYFYDKLQLIQDFVKVVVYMSDVFMFVDSQKAVRVHACCISALSRFYRTFEGIFMKAHYFYG